LGLEDSLVNEALYVFIMEFLKSFKTLFTPCSSRIWHYSTHKWQSLFVGNVNVNIEVLKFISAIEKLSGRPSHHQSIANPHSPTWHRKAAVPNLFCCVPSH